MRCRRYRREGRVRRVRCVRRVWCQRRVILLTAVTAGAPHLEVRTRLVTVVPRLLLHHHPCTQTRTGRRPLDFRRSLISRRVSRRNNVKKHAKRRYCPGMISLRDTGR